MQLAQSRRAETALRIAGGDRNWFERPQLAPKQIGKGAGIVGDATSLHLEKLNRAGLILREHTGCQPATEHAPGVEVGAEGPNIGLATHKRRMAVHNVLAEVVPGLEERLADPEARLRIVLWGWQPRIETRMHEVPLRVFGGERQLFEPRKRLRIHAVRHRGFEGVERRIAPVHEPVLVEVIVACTDGIEHHLLVVAAKAYDVLRVSRLQLSKGGDHLRAVWPSVDVVTEEDELARAAGAVFLDIAEQPIELISAAVDVANGVGQHGLPCSDPDNSTGSRHAFCTRVVLSVPRSLRAPSMIERCAEERTRLNVSGMILIDEHRTTPCIISDRSATGIRVTLPRAEELPDTFILTVDGTGEAIVCRAAWRRLYQIGCITDALIVEWQAAAKSERTPAWA